jgi:hypothetical protein
VKETERICTLRVVCEVFRATLAVAEGTENEKATSVPIAADLIGGCASEQEIKAPQEVAARAAKF